MGKLILILLLLLNLNSWPSADIGGTTMKDPGYSDRYMELMERRDERGPVPLEEQVRVLEGLGVDVPEGEIIFFCTEEWAREFEEATLCYMRVTALH